MPSERVTGIKSESLSTFIGISTATRWMASSCFSGRLVMRSSARADWNKSSEIKAEGRTAAGDPPMHFAMLCEKCAKNVSD